MSRVSSTTVLIVFLFGCTHAYKSYKGCPSSLSRQTIDENTNPGTILFNITGLNNPPQITAESSEYHLELENVNGNYLIKTNKSFDYEKLTNGVFKFSLLCDGATFKDLLLIVNNVIEDSPHFSARSYHADIPENETIATTVLEFEIINTEKVQTPVLKLEPDYNMFDIDAVKESLILKNELNYENTAQYVFNISAYTPETNFTDTAQIVINVLDSDDQPPEFTQKSYSVTIPENAIVRSIWNTTPITLAQDKDTGINETIEYSLIGGFPHDYFHINKENGSLILWKPLDRENITRFGLTIKAYQIDKPILRTDIAAIDITIEDVNDNSPIISVSNHTLIIPENTPTGTVISDVFGSDIDKGKNSIFEYKMEEPSSAFLIDKKHGMITVGNSTMLDRETQDTYKLTVYAEETETKEHMRSNNVSIEISLKDENDNSPIFHQRSYLFVVNKTILKEIGQVNATDNDINQNGQIRYSLHGDVPQIQRFSVHPITGQLFVNESLSNNYQQQYNFFVVATDQAMPVEMRRTTSVPVLIHVLDVNINAPKLLHIKPVSIREDAPVGSLIAILKATDLDMNDTLHYGITNGNPLSQFGINGSSGEIRLNRSLNRENISQYDLDVLVTDSIHNDSDRLTVKVLDVNDNAPTFNNKSYVFHIKESYMGIVFPGNEAHDIDEGPNGQLTYSMESFWSSNFTINETTGEIQTATKLNREDTLAQQIGDLKIYVTASDNGSPRLRTEADITVNIDDINDNAPVFEQANVNLTIKEKDVLPNIYTAKAFDADTGDNSIIKYRMQSGNSSIFYVHLNGTLGNHRKIDIDKFDNAEYDIVIEAYNIKHYSDNSLHNPTQTISIKVMDINDCVPQFNSSTYTFIVREDLPIGSKLNGSTRIVAIDKDRSHKFSTVTYWLEGTDSSHFTINQTTAELSTTRSFDYENKTSFEFKVFASDMEPSSGNDTVLNDYSQITVKVSDVNDNTPTFSKDTYYCSFKEEEVGQSTRCIVNATDRDTDKNGNIKYKIKQTVVHSPQDNQKETFKVCSSHCSFDINITTGELKPSVSLDRDNGQNMIEVAVEAVDGGNPSRTGTSTVMVLIEDINDNPPVFYDTEFTYVFDETMKPELFHNASAYDLDTGNNSLIHYTLKSSTSNAFTVLSNGSITATEELQIHNVNDSKITIEIEAYNVIAYSNRSMSNATQTITLLVKFVSSEYIFVGHSLSKALFLQDVNNNTPDLKQQNYIFTLKENVSVGTQLTGNASILAIDDDISYEFSSVWYWMSGPGSEQFYIDSRTGIITVIKHLDYETENIYNFKVFASDMHQYFNNNGICNASANVTIYLEDINDNSPRFSSDHYSCYLKEEYKGQIPDCIINATDKDHGPNGIITYRIAQNSVNDRSDEYIQRCSTNCGFSINGTTGNVITETSFDRENGTNVKMLIVEAVDEGHPKQSNSSVVTVYIEDINDHAPVFDDANITYVFDELLMPDIFHVARANDDDIGSNSLIAYNMIEGNESIFEVQIDGTVLIKEQPQLDAKSNGFFVIQIEASNTKKYDIEGLCNATQTIHIILKDVNNHYPKFTRSNYTFSVFENGTFGHLDGKYSINATDEDTSSEFNTVSYWLYGDGREYFNIGKHSGLISITKQLDFEKRQIFYLKVFASDMHPLFNNGTVVNVSADVTITILDVNEIPKFTKEHYYCYLKEETLGNVSDCKISAVDNETGNNGNLTYRLKTAEQNELEGIDEELIEVCFSTRDCGFTIDGKTGLLSTNETFDREKGQTIKMILVEVVDGGTPPLSSHSVVTIFIEDINDNPPVFDDTDITFIFKELTEPKIFHTAKAHDDDVGNNSVITYTMREGNESIFEVQSNGTILIKEKLHIDTSNNGYFKIEIEASNTEICDIYGFCNATQTIHIVLEDVNDHVPMFSKTNFTYEVLEDLPLRTRMNYSIDAVDADASEEFNTVHFWLGGSGSENFDINALSGIISIAKPLDYETDKSYHFIVYASDNHASVFNKSVMTSSASVNIIVKDINDNAPKFSHDTYSCSVEENAPNGTLVCQINATDADITKENNGITYRVLPSDRILPFEIEEVTGRIVVAGVVDFDEGNSSYSFHIYATDNGFPRLNGSAMVTIEIKNRNDNPPEFKSKSYNFSIDENEPVETVIGVIQAVDKDGDNVSFSLLNYTNEFSIDEYGILSTKKMFDYEQQERFFVAINVTDGLFSTSTTLEINIRNINDNNPEFENDTYNVQIPENVTSDTLIEVSATDMDCIGKLNYSIVDYSSNCMVFNIDSVSGSISYENKDDCLDHETMPFISILVEVTDGGQFERSGRAVVEIEVIDSNDRCPYFLYGNYSASITENATVGTEIMKVMAIDDDTKSEDLTYSIVEPKRLFQISGNVIKTNAKLDWETQKEYKVNISVSDGFCVHYSNVHLEVKDVNDNYPIFEGLDHTATVVQNAPVGKIVKMINVTDADESGGFTFYITGARGDFKIDERTGVITVSRNEHFVVNSTYNITIHVIDFGDPPLRNTTWLYVYIDTSNHHAPTFTGTPYKTGIFENSDVGMSVFNVSVIDEDVGDNGDIVYDIVSGGEGKFWINDTSGEVFLNSSVDFETRQHKPYKLVLEAKDMGDNPLSATTALTITVKDINEPPRFPNNHLELCMNLPMKKDAIVGVINAIDSDSNEHDNNKLNYTIMSGDPLGIFQINDRGVISTSKMLNQTLPRITLTILAMDGGGLNDTAIVSIAVIESSGDGTQPSVIIVYVPENKTGSYIITDVNTTDESYVEYSIVNSSLPGWFHIVNNTGVIKACRPLDHEAEKTISLEIQADRKGGGSNSSMCHSQVVINVEDINDNSPHFIDPHIVVSVNESDSSSVDPSCIIEIDAYDRDDTSKLMFNITSDDSDGLFSLRLTNSSSSCLYVNGILDFEAIPESRHGKFAIEMMVSDGKYNDTGSVEISVMDVNDNTPYFENSEYSFSVSEDSRPLTIIHQIEAYDNDNLDKGKLRFNMTGVESTSFSLSEHEDTVDLILYNHLDRENTSNYNFDILVFDTCGNQNNTRINITVLDVNDNAPVFQNSSYEITVNEGPQSLALMSEIHATDADQNENALVSFSLIRNEISDSFSLNKSDLANTADFKVIKELDRDHAANILKTGEAKYTVDIKAYDHGNPSLSTSVEYKNTRLKLDVPDAFPPVAGSSFQPFYLFPFFGASVPYEELVSEMCTSITSKLKPMNIYVLDINDCVPSFEKTMYNISILEGSPAGFSVFSVEATDCDFYPENKNISYSLSGSDKDQFIISEDGEILLNTTISVKDFNTPYNIIVNATDGVNSNKTSLYIHVTDVNDHDPHFGQDIYNFTTPENDYHGASYNVVVGTVNATDEDYGRNGAVMYKILSTDMLEKFNISDDGTITTAGELNHDSCLTNVLSFTVAAMDKGQPRRTGYTEVVVYVMDVNDNSPSFSSISYQGSVPEDSVNDTVVIIRPAIWADDIDNGENGTTGISYTFDGEDSSAFTINNRTGMICVKNGNSLDREIKETYRFTVTATDRYGEGRSDTANLTISLTDVNDEAPIFIRNQYVFNVSEAANVSTVVGIVQATDMDIHGNQSIRYSIESGANGRFYIDKFFGIIYVTGGLDREQDTVYRLNVSATDGINEDIANVSIFLEDVNDNSPEFGSPQILIEIEEDRFFNHSVVLMNLTARDSDEGENGMVIFIINDTDTLNISISSGNQIIRYQKLDREACDRYEFVVYARDNGSPPRVSKQKVILHVKDINDNSPKFYNIENKETKTINRSIIEKTPVGSPVVFPNVKDEDIGENGRVSFNISGLPVDVASYFHIDSKTGFTTISKPINAIELEHLNLTENDMMHLVISATDEGQPPLSTKVYLNILVDKISDDSPDFERSSYLFEIQEDASNESFVGRVKATENTTFFVLRYSILPHTLAKGYFFVHPLTGNITTTRNLNREEQETFTFPVQVVDGRTPERTAFTMVSILLKDINDNKPKFKQDEYVFKVQENTNISPIFVTADDPDKGYNGTITYQISSADGCAECLLLDENTGTITLNKTFDREEDLYTHLTIKASDGGTPHQISYVNVTFIVLDTNDNSPEFQYESYQCNITENKSPGQILVKIHATDADNGLNGTVVYSLLKPSDMFDINAFDGTMVTLASLDYESQSAYTVTVVASDLGSPQRNASTNVTILVIDEFDEEIVFNETMYMANLTTELPINTHIITVSTGLKDVSYNIKDGNDAGYFKLNSSTGELQLNLVMHESGNYLLLIEAAFVSHPHIATITKVFILVQSSSDNANKNNSYTVSIMENLDTSNGTFLPDKNTTGIFLLDVNTTEELSGQYVRYKLIQTIPSGNFAIEKNTGKIYCLDALDRETHSRYTLHISVVTSISRRSKRSFGDSPGEIIVLVNVGNENDNDPMFVSGNTIYASPFTKKGDYISSISAIDLDDGDGQNIRFSLVDNNATFSVDAATGDLYSQSQLSFRETYKVTIKATDNNGTGRHTESEFQIILLPPNDHLILSMPISYPDYKIKQEYLLRYLSNILGINISVEKAQAHISENILHPTPQTYLYFYGINRTSKTVLPADTVKRLITAKSEEIADLFRNSSFEVKFIPVPHNYKLSEAEIALLTLSVIILISCIFAIIFTQIIWKRDNDKKDDKSVMWELTSMGSASVRSLRGSSVGVVNPVFQETKFDENSNSPNVEGTQLKRPEYESQELTMNFLSESLSQAGDVQNDEAAAKVSIGDSGTSTISGENDSNNGSFGDREEIPATSDVTIPVEIGGENKTLYDVTVTSAIDPEVKFRDNESANINTYGESSRRLTIRMSTGESDDEINESTDTDIVTNEISMLDNKTSSESAGSLSEVMTAKTNSDQEDTKTCSEYNRQSVDSSAPEEDDVDVEDMIATKL